MPLIDFNTPLITGNSEGLTLTEDAIAYATQISNNQLIDTGINSGFRLLLEAQVYVYGEILNGLLAESENLEQAVYRLLSYSIKEATAARATLKFTLYQNYSRAIIIPKAFPVQSLNGIMFTTDEILTIAAESRTGYVTATAIQTGEVNVPKNTINLPKQILTVPLLVTNDSEIIQGSSEGTLSAAKLELATLLSRVKTVSAADYVQRLKEYNSSYFAVVSEEPDKTLTIAIGKNDGTFMLPGEIGDVQSFYESVKYIGIKKIQVINSIILPLFIEITLRVDAPTSFQEEADRMSLSLRDYLLPGGEAQTKRVGIIILEEIKRLLNNFSYDYLQTIRVGTTESNAVGNNFVFNQYTERCRLSTLKLNLVNDVQTSLTVYNF